MKITLTKSFFLPLAFLFILMNIQKSYAQDIRELFDKKYAISKDSARVFSNRLLQSDNIINRAFGHISRGYICT